ncbi:MAG: IS607 family transposase [Deltaproteobacteria bacterium]|nr:IS607 family transposase [Deltaproteobacteria bacterium]MBW2069345.1 IS607 family transposase [Deltaproteobacteria bacterium]
MSRLYRIGNAARILGVSVQTLRRWDKEGKLKPIRVGKERRYREEDLLKFLGEDRPNAVAVYARVSSHDQKKDLESQLEFLRRAVTGSFSQIYEVKDAASGIKGNRKGLLKLIELAKTKKIRAIAVTYPDRLTRFSFDAFVEFFKALGVDVLVLNGEEQEEPERELVEDLIAILTSFAGKLYGVRSRKIKNFAKELKAELKNEQD